MQSFWDFCRSQKKDEKEKRKNIFADEKNNTMLVKGFILLQ